ncbi:hypothetical protein LJR130_006927 [Variovorax sp. LjRoot130]|uniref:hypothetical protein n=1 Tax=Variovorax sp. LjRoot130 TaxID=3342261 RepID=UPI003ECF58E9
MKIGITGKLFLFVCSPGAAVVVVQGAAIRFVMERGFLGRSAESVQLDRFAELI